MTQNYDFIQPPILIKKERKNQIGLFCDRRMKKKTILSIMVLKKTNRFDFSEINLRKLIGSEHNVIEKHYSKKGKR